MKSNRIVIKRIAAVMSFLMLIMSFAFVGQAAEDVGGTVCIGGFPFGVRVMTDEVSVAELEEIVTQDGHSVCPAADAGLCVHDVILSADGVSISSSEELLGIIGSAQGEIEVVYRRNGGEATAKITPVTDTDGKQRIGVWVRDSTAGIGTLTFYSPETGGFAGLGHGICDADSGELTRITSGVVMDVTISGVNRGTAGVPGEIRGYFGSETVGKLLKNSDTGVYGVLTSFPSLAERYEIAPRGEVHEGEVTIRSTLSDGETSDFSAVITDVDMSSVFGKSFVVKITDEELIRISGGIVQGMSGSPIIQDGKLIGAVTHVMVSDPTKGYGIFAETMFDELCRTAGCG